MHMRAQLLRAEQEKELMRVKLEEEVAEREKAQKQVGGLKCKLAGCSCAQQCTHAAGNCQPHECTAPHKLE